MSDDKRVERGGERYHENKEKSDYYKQLYDDTPPKGTPEREGWDREKAKDK